MTSYLSTLLTNTSSRYTALRQTLLPESAERDGDTEDDSQICRVLRAYYVEKARPFPQWLPPDPKSRRPEPVAQPSSGYFSGAYGSQNGGMSSSYSGGSVAGRNGTPTGSYTAGGGVYRPTAPQQSSSRRTGGLSDLWGDSSGGTSPAQQPQSLRAGRQPSSQALYTTMPHTRPGEALYTTPSQTRFNYGGGGGGGPAQGRGERFANNGPQSARLTPSGARPPPGESEGSYQSLRREYSGSSSSGGGGRAYGASPYGQPAANPALAAATVATSAPATAQDRLKAKLWGSSGRPGAGR